MLRVLGLVCVATWLAIGLTACSDSPAAPPPAPSQVSNVPPTLALTPTSRPRPTPVTPTNSPDFALLPTSTPPALVSPTPTKFPTVTPRQDQTIPDVGPSITAFRTTKASFQVAYARGLTQMNTVSTTAKLVMAQATTFTQDRTIWTFFFTQAQQNRSWEVTYDSAGGKDQKELLTITQRSSVLLSQDAGQLPISKLLDSDLITTRLQQGGLQPDLPIDLVYLQMYDDPKQGRVPVYIFVNGALGKQIVVNALTAQILQNDFI